MFEFMQKVIPNFKSISAVSREKLINSLQLIQYLPGQVIVEEGMRPNKAFLIFEGEVLISASSNPLNTDIDNNG